MFEIVASQAPVPLGITGFLFGDGAIWFSIPAIVGTLFLVAQLVLGEVGGDLDADLDSGTEFRALSLQSIAAFCMGGGWIAFTVMRAMDQSFMVAAIAGVGAGFLMAWAVAWAIAQMVKMQTSGSVSIETAEGETGDVHVSIPPAGEGSGRVAVVLAGKRREYNATQTGGETIPSHTRVRVARADSASNMLVVERA